MPFTVEDLKELALTVKRKVSPLLGSEKAGKTVGLGAGGDRTKLI
ncbi:inositol monophosphatase, partial [Candidatus Bathyarchaeota archaeon]